MYYIHVSTPKSVFKVFNPIPFLVVQLILYSEKYRVIGAGNPDISTLLLM